MSRICVMYFSGTGTTGKVCEKFSVSLKKFFEEVADKDFDKNKLYSNVCYSEISTHNITPLENRNIFPNYDSEDIVIIGLPTIAGRVPNLILPYLKKVEFNNALCVPIVLFGNRNYDDSLMEISKLIENNGGRLIAGAAVVGEHSFSEILAKGRPNTDDLNEIEEFARVVSEKIISENYDVPEIKGCYPLRDYFKPQDRYGNLINFISIKPKTDIKLCDDCKLCVKLCPLGSINYEDVSFIEGKCMKCCACIKKCHKNAKYFDDEGYIFHMRELEEVYFEHKENEFFF